MSGMVTMNIKVKEYTSRVIGVVKEKYGLRDKGEAMDKFAQLFGDEFVDLEVKEEYVKKILRMEEEHFKKHGYAKMSDKELDALFGK